MMDMANTSRYKFIDFHLLRCDNDPDRPVENLELTPEMCLHGPIHLGICLNLTFCIITFLVTFVISLVYSFRWSLRLKLFHLGNWWRMKSPQKMESNPDCMYDAFVCYHHRDSRWVRKVLVEELEKRSNPRLKLCIYERDWLAGRDIVDCIREAIDKSRKVLLVVTNAFALSQWGYLEMTMAYHTIMDTDRDNVIVAVMEDLDPINLNPRLALLMKRRTYLEWTEDADGQELFWERMKQTLHADGESLLGSLPTDEETMRAFPKN
jgi:hypothetical protein